MKSDCAKCFRPGIVRRRLRCHDWLDQPIGNTRNQEVSIVDRDVAEVSVAQCRDRVPSLNAISSGSSRARWRSLSQVKIR